MTSASGKKSPGQMLRLCIALLCCCCCCCSQSVGESPPTENLYVHQIVESPTCRYQYGPRGRCAKNECRMSREAFLGTSSYVAGLQRPVCRPQLPRTAQHADVYFTLDDINAHDGNCTWAALSNSFHFFKNLGNNTWRDVTQEETVTQDYSVSTVNGSEPWCRSASLQPSGDPFANKCGLKIHIQLVEPLVTGYFQAVYQPANAPSSSQYFVIELVESLCDICFDPVTSQCKHVGAPWFFPPGTNGSLESPIRYGPSVNVEEGKPFCLVLDIKNPDGVWDFSSHPVGPPSRTIQHSQIVSIHDPPSVKTVSVQMLAGVRVMQNCLYIASMTPSLAGDFIFHHASDVEQLPASELPIALVRIRLAEISGSPSQINSHDWQGWIPLSLSIIAILAVGGVGAVGYYCYRKRSGQTHTDETAKHLLHKRPDTPLYQSMSETVQSPADRQGEGEGIENATD